jgi:hypothetical protein
MKAWRKYNAGVAKLLKARTARVEFLELAGYAENHSEIKKAEIALDYIPNKIPRSQRKTQMAPTQQQPSGLLYVLFANAGFKIPDSIDSLLHGSRISAS